MKIYHRLSLKRNGKPESAPQITYHDIDAGHFSPLAHLIMNTSKFEYIGSHGTICTSGEAEHDQMAILHCYKEMDPDLPL